MADIRRVAAVTIQARHPMVASYKTGWRVSELLITTRYIFGSCSIKDVYFLPFSVMNTQERVCKKRTHETVLQNFTFCKTLSSSPPCYCTNIGFSSNVFCLAQDARPALEEDGFRDISFEEGRNAFISKSYCFDQLLYVETLYVTLEWIIHIKKNNFAFKQALWYARCIWDVDCLIDSCSITASNTSTRHIYPP